jgi:hypothetical protein
MVAQKKTNCLSHDRSKGCTVTERSWYRRYDVKQVPKIKSKGYLIVSNKDRKEPRKKGQTYHKF